MSRPVLRVVSPQATDEEVAAILAAVTAAQVAVTASTGDDTLHEWVRGARLSARRSGLQRGPWRLSGRIGRRTRA